MTLWAFERLGIASGILRFGEGYFICVWERFKQVWVQLKDTSNVKCSIRSAITSGWICKNRSPISTPITGEEQKDDGGEGLTGFRWWWRGKWVIGYKDLQQERKMVWEMGYAGQHGHWIYAPDWEGTLRLKNKTGNPMKCTLFGVIYI